MMNGASFRTDPPQVYALGPTIYQHYQFVHSDIATRAESSLPCPNRCFLGHPVNFEGGAIASASVDWAASNCSWVDWCRWLSLSVHQDLTYTVLRCHRMIECFENWCFSLVTTWIGSSGEDDLLQFDPYGRLHQLDHVLRFEEGLLGDAMVPGGDYSWSLPPIYFTADSDFAKGTCCLY